MVLPTKHESLHKNILVVGAEIIRLLKDGAVNIEDMYQSIKRLTEISVDRFYDTILFLWIMDYVSLNEGLLILNKTG